MSDTIDPQKSQQELMRLAQQLFGASNAQGNLKSGPTTGSNLWFDDAQMKRYDPSGVEYGGGDTGGEYITTNHATPQMYTQMYPQRDDDRGNSNEQEPFWRELTLRFPELVQSIYGR